LAGPALAASRIFSVSLMAWPEQQDTKVVSLPLDAGGGGGGSMGVSSSGSLYQSMALASLSWPSDPSAHDICAVRRVIIEPVVSSWFIPKFMIRKKKKKTHIEHPVAMQSVEVEA